MNCKYGKYVQFKKIGQLALPYFFDLSRGKERPGFAKEIGMVGQSVNTFQCVKSPVHDANSKINPEVRSPMRKEEIISRLSSEHQLLVDHICSLPEKDFNYSLNGGKWTAVQQLDHIRRALQPLVWILMVPKPLLKWYLKKANRPSKTYEQLVEKYHAKLKGGSKARGRFVPPTVPFSSRQRLAEDVMRLAKKLGKLSGKFSETEMEQLVLPHPLLGYITLREMLYFTVYHAKHHLELTRNNLTTANTVHHGKVH
jgi:hypothetical protein